MIMWSSLYTWKHSFCYTRSIFFFCHDYSSPRSSEGLMCCGRHYIAVWHWILDNSSSDESRDMCDVSHEYSSDTICDLSKTFPIKRTRVCRKSSDNKFWFMFSRESLNLVHIYPLCFLIEYIWYDIVGFS
jgi:hypothetical protein